MKCQKELYMRGVKDMAWQCVLEAGHEGKCSPPRCGRLTRHRFCDFDRYWGCALPVNHPGECI